MLKQGVQEANDPMQDIFAGFFGGGQRGGAKRGKLPNSF